MMAQTEPIPPAIADDLIAQTRIHLQQHDVEATALLAALLPVTERLMADRDQLAARLDVARRDPLTGLSTRRAWEEQAEQIAELGETTIVFCDLDRFKQINDRNGHRAGDLVLIVTARRLIDWCGPAGIPGRIGGDEFVAAVPNAGDLDERVAKLQDLLQQPINYCGRELRVGASIGIARRVGALSEAMEAADQAMYRVKGRGRRGRWLVPTPLAFAVTLARRVA